MERPAVREEEREITVSLSVVGEFSVCRRRTEESYQVG